MAEPGIRARLKRDPRPNYAVAGVFVAAAVMLSVALGVTAGQQLRRRSRPLPS